MSEPEVINHNQRRWPRWPFIGLILLAAGVYLLSRCGSQERPLKPQRPTATVVEMTTVQGQSVSISFSDLNEDPSALRDQRIRVSGAFTGLTAADCASPRGPNPRWALIADDLQLDAVGFEQLLRLVSPGTNLTVVGVWRAYSGPAGCGKNAAVQSIWYLDVEHIIEPNPLLAAGPSSESETKEPTTAIAPEGIETSTPSPTPSDSDFSATTTPVATPTMTPMFSRTPTPTAVGTTPAVMTATPTPTGGTATPTASATARLPGSPTVTSTSTTQPDATSTSAAATSQPTQTSLASTPPVSTATPGGYPGPAETPGSGTATPTGYP